MASFSHKSVLLKETVDSLNIKSGGIYLDCTAGGGGHSAEILSRLDDTGRLIAMDQDPDAIDNLMKHFEKDHRVIICQSNFSKTGDIFKELNISSIDGAMLDLGVSSHQLDTAERGFSYRKEAPLDMRMSKSGTTAAELVNTLPPAELARILVAYGDEKYASAIVKAVVKERTKSPIETTTQLAEIVKSAYPAKARRDGHPARQTFQALRIAVNHEMESLSEGLDAVFELLKPGGRLAVITFHSLEDRTVKLRMKKWTEGCTCPRDFPICVCGKSPMAKILTKKPIRPSPRECEENSRSRSARLHVCEKTKIINIKQIS